VFFCPQRKLALFLADSLIPPEGPSTVRGQDPIFLLCGLRSCDPIFVFRPFLRPDARVLGVLARHVGLCYFPARA